MSADQPFTDEMEVHPDQVAGHGTLIKTRYLSSTGKKINNNDRRKSLIRFCFEYLWLSGILTFFFFF